MGYVFSAPAQAVVPVADSSDLFPVHRIYCIGRNYAEHQKEMGFSGREAPFFFMKPADAVLPVTDGNVGEFPYPTETKDVHHEMELVVAIGRASKRGEAVSLASANEYIWGYGVGLDMTRRDLQGEAKKQGRPWEVGKAFDYAAPISALRPVSKTGFVTKGSITLDVNGKRRQDSDVSKMIWNVAESIEYVSRFFQLLPGDLLYTGTPEGVAAVQKGDLLEGTVEGVGSIRIKVV